MKIIKSNKNKKQYQKYTSKTTKKNNSKRVTKYNSKAINEGASKILNAIHVNNILVVDIIWIVTEIHLIVSTENV